MPHWILHGLVLVIHMVFGFGFRLQRAPSQKRTRSTYSDEEYRNHMPKIKTRETISRVPKVSEILSLEAEPEPMSLMVGNVVRVRGAVTHHNDVAGRRRWRARVGLC